MSKVAGQDFETRLRRATSQWIEAAEHDDRTPQVGGGIRQPIDRLRSRPGPYWTPVNGERASLPARGHAE